MSNLKKGPGNSFSEKCIGLFKKAKELLSKDYSMQDLKKLKSLPKELKQALSTTRLASAKATSALEIVPRFDAKQLPVLLQAFVLRNRQILLVLLFVAVLLVINMYVVSPFAQRVQNQLDMRPAQWSQLQSLIKLAKSAAANASGSAMPSSYLATPSTVSSLDEMEMQKIRSVLTSRGIKPSVLRLTADNPPRIEMQASDAMFSVLLDVLDELRTTWRLYPEQLNVVSSSGAGVVNISGVLVQYGAQFANPTAGMR